MKPLDDLLISIQKPGRYTGGEWNQVRKDIRTVRTKVGLVFPDLYEVGMSHLGQKILYHVLNAEDDICAERVYAPDLDFELRLRQAGEALFSLENRLPLSSFDILGFSLLYELNYSNIPTILDLGRIPLSARERTEAQPLIIGGGPAAFNPEPLADVFDLFLIGDGEEAFLEIVRRYQELKSSQIPRSGILEALSLIEGVYVPSFFSPYPLADGLHWSIRSDREAGKRIRKRIFSKFTDTPFPPDIIVPNIRTVFERVSVELARGCLQKCRFCQAVNLYFPLRSKDPQVVVESAVRGLDATGFEEISLAALSAGDYPPLESAVCSLMTGLEERRIALSLSSLRPKTLTPTIAENILRVKKTGVTLVPEAGSERLRRVINKDIKDSELEAAVKTAFSRGWDLVKLYFMVGLPTETDEDLNGIVGLVQEVIAIGRSLLGRPPRINLSLSSFIPKPHTPFQWAAMEDASVLRDKQHYLRSRLKRFRSIKFKNHDIESSVLEGVFSRGDRRLGPVLLRAWEKGARFDSWTDRFDFSRWRQAFEEETLDFSLYLGELDREGPLPWDHIDVGLEKSYLRRELDRALRAESTPLCKDTGCGECSGCRLGPVVDIAADTQILVPPSVIEPLGEMTDEAIRYRVTYGKTGIMRYISHIDLINLIQRCLRRAGIAVLYSKGFHPKMMLTFPPALPLGMEGRLELFEFRSFRKFSENQFLERMRPRCPEGLNISGIERLEIDRASLNEEIRAFHYSLDLERKAAKAAVMTLCGAESGENVRDSETCLEARLESYIQESEHPSLESLELEKEKRRISIRIRNLKGDPMARPQDIVGDILGLESGVFLMSREKIAIEPLYKGP